MTEILKKVFVNNPALVEYTDEELCEFRAAGIAHSIRLIKELEEDMKLLQAIKTELEKRQK
jgi:hypothetical protein